MRTTWSGGIKHAHRNKFLEHGLRCAAVKRQARIGRIAKDLVGDSGECEREDRSEGFIPVEPNTKLTLVLASPAHVVIREVESTEEGSWKLGRRKGRARGIELSGGQRSRDVRRGAPLCTRVRSPQRRGQSLACTGCSGEYRRQVRVFAKRGPEHANAGLIAHDDHENLDGGAGGEGREGLGEMYEIHALSVKNRGDDAVHSPGRGHRREGARNEPVVADDRHAKVLTSHVESSLVRGGAQGRTERTRIREKAHASAVRTPLSG